MVTIHFKLFDAGTIQLEIDKPTRFNELLKRCPLHLDEKKGGFIAVRNHSIITGNELVSDSDEIEVFPALSGG